MAKFRKDAPSMLGNPFGITFLSSLLTMTARVLLKTGAIQALEAAAEATENEIDNKVITAVKAALEALARQ